MRFFVSSRSNLVFTAMITIILSLFLSPTASQAADGDLKWAFDTEGRISWSSPAIGTHGTIYIGCYGNPASASGRLYAINPDGTKKWESPRLSDYELSTPAIGWDGVIYIAKSYALYAINPDGTEKWSVIGSYLPFSPPYLTSSPAIAVDGTIYWAGAFYGQVGVQAINPHGTVMWSFAPFGCLFYSSPAIGSDGTIYVGSEDGVLYAINPDGTCKWNTDIVNSVYSSPAIGSDGTIYVGSEDGVLYAINPDGTVKWDFLTNGFVWSSPAIGEDGAIYVGSSDGVLYAINPDGTLRWIFPTTLGGSIYSSPAIGADGTIYVGSTDGHLYAINPNGTEKWESLGGSIWSSPAIGDDGTIYVGSHDSNLYTFEGSSGGPAHSIWPMFRHDLRRTGRVDPAPPAIFDTSCDPMNYAVDVNPLDYAESISIAFTEPLHQVEIISISPPDLTGCLGVHELSADRDVLIIYLLGCELPYRAEIVINLEATDYAGDMAALTYWFTTSGYSIADCPPPIDPGNPLADAINNVENWIDGGWYDPADGYLPEDHPILPWAPMYEPDTVAEIVDGKLRISGYGETGTDQAAHYRLEEALSRPDAMYVIQIRCKVLDIDPYTDVSDQTMLTAGASDFFDRVPIFSLRYQAEERVVVLGTNSYCHQPEFVMPIDWTNETTYTLLVTPGEMVYLEVDTGYWMERSYWEMFGSGGEPELVSFISGTVQAEYSYVHYCIGLRDEAIYYGQVVDLRPTLPPLYGAEGKIALEINDAGFYYPNPSNPPGEEAILHFDLDILELPGYPSEQFEFTTTSTVDIQAFDPVKTITHEQPVSELGHHEYDVAWDGTVGLPLEPGTPYIYRAKVEFIREKIDQDKFKYFDTVVSPWRLVIMDNLTE